MQTYCHEKFRQAPNFASTPIEHYTVAFGLSDRIISKFGLNQNSDYIQLISAYGYPP